MTLSSDELEVLDYLKSWKGKYVAMVEICRCAGGRKKFKESPNWAKPLMARLVESQMVEVNERGHYRIVPEKEPGGAADPARPAKGPKMAVIIGDNYFPATDGSEAEPERWVSPQIAAILKKAGKKAGSAHHG